MESIRYYLALALVICVPGIYLFWFSIHPLIRFWRKVGPRLTLALHFLMMAVVAAAIFRIRHAVLSVEYGTNWLLIALAVPLAILAIRMRRQIAKEFPARTLVGLPELAPSAYPAELVTTGIYARIRHPRYVQIMLALSAHALFSNYLALYGVVLLGFPMMLMVAKLEERELRERFGNGYTQYCKQVPRFLPKLR